MCHRKGSREMGQEMFCPRGSAVVSSGKDLVIITGKRVGKKKAGPLPRYPALFLDCSVVRVRWLSSLVRAAVVGGGFDAVYRSGRLACDLDALDERGELVGGKGL